MKELCIVAAGARDLTLFESLSREAMAPYYQKHGYRWETQAFQASYAGTENYLLQIGSETVGVLRYSHSSTGLYVHDLHLQPAMRGQGIGSAVLERIEGEARSRGAATVRMRVFSGNPALRLYERRGYRRAGVEEAWVRVELALGGALPPRVGPA